MPSNQTAEHGALPFEGVRVLDFSRFVQGPFAAKLLSSLGATVVKVEDRDGGDMARRVSLDSDGFSGFFQAYNAGKRSVALDLRSDSGREIALKLAQSADVLVENFRPGTMRKLGLDYESVKAVNPRIIYASGSGFGTLGPHRDWPMFDTVGQAVSGLMDLAAGEDGEPRIAVPGLADQVAAVFLALGIASALYRRAVTGRGQLVESSLFGACVALQSAEITSAARRGYVKHPRRRVHSTTGQFRCADGKWLVIAANDQRMWLGLCRALNRPDLAADPRYAHGRSRELHHAELEPELERAFLARTRDEWIEILHAADVPVGPAQSFVDLPNDEDALANGYIRTTKSSQHGNFNTVGLPILFDGQPTHPDPVAPDYGADTYAVLVELGYGEEQIAQLAVSGVI